MRFFTLDTTADLNEACRSITATSASPRRVTEVQKKARQVERDKTCFSDNTPDGIGTRWYRLSSGVPFGTDYPTDVQLRLGDDFPGLKLPSFIGNTSGLLIVDTKAAALILTHDVGRTERLAFALIDHRGEVHSRDYVFLNPLECINCVNLEHSVVRRSRKGAIRVISKLVLAESRRAALIDLFRVGEEPAIYVFSERVVSALVQAGCTNFAFREAPLR
jgi:hypothetical protein